MKRLLVFITTLMLVSVAVGCAPQTGVSTTPVAPQPIAASPDKRPYWPTQEGQATVIRYIKKGENKILAFFEKIIIN